MSSQTVEKLSFYDESSGSLTLPDETTDCPRCKQTSMYTGAATVHCRYCNADYYQKGNGLLDFCWIDEQGKEVYSEVNDLVERLHWQAEWNHQAPVYYLTSSELQSISPETYHPDSGSFVSNHNIILLPANMGEKKRIYTLAHEMGHSIDLEQNHKGNVKEFAKANALEKEKLAWLHAAEILHGYGWDQWDDFINFVMYCLKSYYLKYVGSSSDCYLFGLGLVSKINELDIEMWEWRTHHEHRIARKEK